MTYLSKFYQTTGFKTTDAVVNARIISVLSTFQNLTRKEQEDFVSEFYNGQYISLCIWMLMQPSQQE